MANTTEGQQSAYATGELGSRRRGRGEKKGRQRDHQQRPTSTAKRGSSGKRRQREQKTGQEYNPAEDRSRERVKAAKKCERITDGSETPLSLEDLRISYHQVEESPADAKGIRYKGERDKRRNRRRRESSKTSIDLSISRPSHPKHEKRRSSSVGPARAFKEQEKRRCHSHGPHRPYAGAMIKMVEQMHGSGTTLDVGDALRISRHSQQRFTESILHKQSHDPLHVHPSERFHASMSSSSASSFAVASQHEWTGWSSSSSADPHQEITHAGSIPNDQNRTDQSVQAIEERNVLHVEKSSALPLFPRKKKRRYRRESTMSTTETTSKTKLSPKNPRNIISNSSHGTPSVRRGKLTVQDVQKMYSSAPSQVGYQKTKKRSVLRLKELLATYEGTGSEDDTKTSSKALPPIPNLDDFASPRATPKRLIGKVDSGSSTVRQTNRSKDIVDPEEQTEKHANISHRTASSGNKIPPPPTSSTGYYSPWRAANARRYLIRSNPEFGAASPHKKPPRSVAGQHPTPSTQPLTSSPEAKRVVETNVMLSEISPPPLSSPPSSRNNYTPV